MNIEFLPLEVVIMITDHLNVRSFARFTMTCKMYYELHSKVFKRKYNLFKSSVYTHIIDDGTIIKFIPGPAIGNFPRKMPIEGVYFYNGDRRNLSFFYKNFSKFLGKKSKGKVGYKYVATIYTKEKKIHNHDLGVTDLRNDGKFSGLYHYNDIDGNYRELFAIGKEKIAEFWRQY